jgi:hypothetical protein
MTSSSEIYVTYIVRQRGRLQTTPPESLIPQSATVDLPESVSPGEIPAYIRQRLRPHREADPSDNYRGQSPDEVVILNMVRLESLA